ncbi:hypothetical protein LV89_01536 [Arcicella aurantiaca]|uniref:DUF5703 domain-containing protein n=1 Tax=Arcicella aurantiaca TaxID=591202 RepID=A0A316EB31_9BACT|nr:DUF5703 domain-containing protein [Arcicella aurantiaca]PWK27645.1 hypothetical protein LV89_01536 [Arcicella aurantiaca]
MKKTQHSIIGIILLCLYSICAFTQNNIDDCNITWKSQSKNSSESMPCGGGDIGLNVWVENGNLLFYMARSGTFDNNNSVLKLGRVRVKLSPNPFENSDSFSQTLVLKDGNVVIKGKKDKLESAIKIWVDVFHPIIHVEVESNQQTKMKVAYENWRFEDRILKGKENNQNSYKWAPQGIVKTRKDSIRFENNNLIFFHQNADEQSAFDVTVKQQGLDSLKEKLYNPIKHLIFGGFIDVQNCVASGTSLGKYQDTDFKAWNFESKQKSKSHEINIYLQTEKTEKLESWANELQKLIIDNQKSKEANKINTQNWWKNFWEKSFIYINSASQKNTTTWQVGRNYQLFRYQLACNAFGKYPTKFNGGLFTVDPIFTDSTLKFTPDFRNWGGGTHTAQNQRLVYWGMLKSGDIEMMKPQFDFYQNILKNAELRTEFYWKHKGASFTEQIENFGLPNPAEYGWKRPKDYDKGMEYNAWLEYEWDTVLEFCLMMLETERFEGKNIQSYIPFIESCLTFFDEHYQYLAKNRGSKALDGDKHLILYPSSGAETYKMAYNSTSTITGLQTVLSRLLALPNGYLSQEKREQWEGMLKRIPPINFRTFEGKTTISPAKHWERINNSECPQLYPVFPWGMYGIGKAGLDTAINTYLYDADALRFRSHIGWKQDNIFAARLGLTDEASRLTLLKLQDSPRRFPTFWGPGYDWTPDHNWGGSGMIGLQEMLLQTDDKKIYLFPAWDKTWDVHFKLHAPYQTTVEGILKNGKVESLIVTPSSRQKDVVLMLK